MHVSKTYELPMKPNLVHCTEMLGYFIGSLVVDRFTEVYGYLGTETINSKRAVLLYYGIVLLTSRELGQHND